MSKMINSIAAPMNPIIFNKIWFILLLPKFIKTNQRKKLINFNRGSYRAQRVILLPTLRAKRGQHAIAGITFDGSAKMIDDIDQRIEKIVKMFREFLIRDVACGEFGKPA